jgi:hypothetical protein
MKKVTVLFLLAFICFGAGLIANKTGVATNQLKDRTGSPVSQTAHCEGCHTGGSFNTAISIRLKDSFGNLVTEYLSGESYTFEVELTGTGPGFGFQAVALFNNNANAGTMTASSSNAKIVTLNNRKYAEQITRSTTGLFTMNWVAPAAGSGLVKFYAAGNCVNANNGTSGDQGKTASPLTITESPLSSVEESKDEMIQVYPNPTSVNVNIVLPFGKRCNLAIYDNVGNLIFSQSDVSNNYILFTDDWAKGIYFIKLTGDINATEKLILQ